MTTFNLSDNVTFNNDLVEQFKISTNSPNKDIQQYQKDVLSHKDEIGVVTELGYAVVTVGYPTMKLRIPKRFLTVIYSNKY